MSSVERRLRELSREEIALLESQGNRAQPWSAVRVADPFDPTLIENVRFRGEVTLGPLEPGMRRTDGLELPIGLRNATILRCRIGANPVIESVGYLGNARLGDGVLLLNVGELVGSPLEADGEQREPGQPAAPRQSPSVAVMNESGSRAIALSPGMIPADAYLWARYRDHHRLQSRLAEMSRPFPARQECYLGDGSEIRQCRILREVRIGPGCRVIGADRIEGAIIDSSFEEPSVVGAGVEILDAVVGRGSQLLGGSTVHRVLLGERTSVELGARVVDTVIGDNSTVACCEVRHALIFPAHEQHHNTSFLIACLLKGQSNIAAGATIGSNHNSRAPDGELVAGRGFWPGLSTSFKHSSRFASYVLVAKGDYPAELDIRFPFSLVSQAADGSRLEVMPAFWWLHNMYALARNGWKFGERDRRLDPKQPVEFEPLAPDTVEEIITARELIEEWTGRAVHREGDRASARERGRELLLAGAEELEGVTVTVEGAERSRRPVVILKPRAAYHAYREMLVHYVGMVLLPAEGAAPAAPGAEGRGPAAPAAAAPGAPKEGHPRVTDWENLGGLITPAESVARLIEEISSGRLHSWEGVHEHYRELHENYSEEKRRHAAAVYRLLLPEDQESRRGWQGFLREFAAVQALRRRRVRESRAKDYSNHFRLATYRSSEEMASALGTLEDNRFVRQIEEETRALEARVASILAGDG